MLGSPVFGNPQFGGWFSSCTFTSKNGRRLEAMLVPPALAGPEAEVRSTLEAPSTSAYSIKADTGKISRLAEAAKSSGGADGCRRKLRLLAVMSAVWAAPQEYLRCTPQVRC